MIWNTYSKELLEKWKNDKVGAIMLILKFPFIIFPHTRKGNKVFDMAYQFVFFDLLGLIFFAVLIFVPIFYLIFRLIGDLAE